MSHMAYHMEARFRQRQIDKALAARQRLKEEEAAREAARCEMVAQQAHERQTRENARKKELEQQIRTRDMSGVKKSYQDREQQLQRLLQERKWHNDMISKMEDNERQHLRSDALRDHKSKSKMLRDHGLYLGDSSFFLDPDYS